MGKRTFACIAKALGASYLTTGFLLFVLAFALYKPGLSESITDLAVAGIYLLSSAIGGFFIGKCMETRRLLWGLMIGVGYVLILFIISLIVRGNLQGFSDGGAANLLLCLGGGALGAFLS